MRRAARTDANHAEIRDGLRARRVWVEDTSGAGRGFPDLIAFAHGRLVLLECKIPKGGKLTPAQVVFHGTAKALGIPVYVVHDMEEAWVAVSPEQRRAA